MFSPCGSCHDCFIRYQYFLTQKPHLAISHFGKIITIRLILKCRKKKKGREKERKDKKKNICNAPGFHCIFVQDSNYLLRLIRVFRVVPCVDSIRFLRRSRVRFPLSSCCTPPYRLLLRSRIRRV